VPTVRARSRRRWRGPGRPGAAGRFRGSVRRSGPSAGRRGSCGPSWSGGGWRGRWGGRAGCQQHTGGQGHSRGGEPQRWKTRPLPERAEGKGGDPVGEVEAGGKGGDRGRAVAAAPAAARRAGQRRPPPATGACPASAAAAHQAPRGGRRGQRPGRPGPGRRGESPRIRATVLTTCSDHRSSPSLPRDI
jgi:hypothetical protein